MIKYIQQKTQVVSEIKNLKIIDLINIKPIANNTHYFFSLSQLSSFLDQTNPLRELTNKRRISTLGPGGISRNRVVSEVRDVYYTHYELIYPIKTPEGQFIYLVNSFALYAKINQYGFIETPYRCVIHEGKKSIITNNIEYMDNNKEKQYVISEAKINFKNNGEYIDDYISASFNGENVLIETNKIFLKLKIFDSYKEF